MESRFSETGFGNTQCNKNIERALYPNGEFHSQCKYILRTISRSGNQGVYHGHDRKSAYVIEKREIGHFTRKLPFGCEASDDAKR